MSFILINIEDDIPIIHTPDINTISITDKERKTAFYINNTFFQDVDLISPDMVEYAISKFHL
jgi:hypothetical protein